MQRVWANGRVGKNKGGDTTTRTEIEIAGSGKDLGFWLWPLGAGRCKQHLTLAQGRTRHPPSLFSHTVEEFKAVYLSSVITPSESVCLSVCLSLLFEPCALAALLLTLLLHPKLPCSWQPPLSCSEMSELAWEGARRGEVEKGGEAVCGVWVFGVWVWGGRRWTPSPSRRRSGARRDRGEAR